MLRCYSPWNVEQVLRIACYAFVPISFYASLAQLQSLQTVLQSVCWAIQYWTEWVLHLEWLAHTRIPKTEEIRIAYVRSLTESFFLQIKRFCIRLNVWRDSKQSEAETHSDRNHFSSWQWLVSCMKWRSGIYAIKLNKYSYSKFKFAKYTIFEYRFAVWWRWRCRIRIEPKSFLKNSSQNSIDGMYDIYSPFHNN